MSPIINQVRIVIESIEDKLKQVMIQISQEQLANLKDILKSSNDIDFYTFSLHLAYIGNKPISLTISPSPISPAKISEEIAE